MAFLFDLMLHYSLGAPSDSIPPLLWPPPTPTTHPSLSRSPPRSSGTSPLIFHWKQPLPHSLSRQVT